MEIRAAVPEDLDEIMRVIDTARAFMRAHGNLKQWINGYPSRELYAGDIADHNCYVIVEDGKVHAVFGLFEGADPTYAVIEDGAWPDDDPYICIHRIGSDGVLHGALRAAVAFALTRCPVVRADTHEDNRVMQQALQKCGFVRCGVIHVADGSPRIAFERPAKSATSV